MHTQRCVSTMKDLVKATARDLSQRDISNIPDREFKAMTKRILIRVTK